MRIKEQEMGSKMGKCGEELNYRVKVRVKGEKWRKSRQGKGLRGIGAREERYQLYFRRT
ncbi:hypothetical protein [Mesobacillus stamsii]|uniref:Uncharacterized protein n=1 Tax=Mesobacillus stamsii TaxID=225347 RepID=A0ABU0FYG7_9BACI|nr:hypothetical protein [Mesobacillus stamsii]MDQ0414982.1 hypothetical protein [Mesobacillus stamsii]